MRPKFDRIFFGAQHIALASVDVQSLQIGVVGQGPALCQVLCLGAFWPIAAWPIAAPFLLVVFGLPLIGRLLGYRAAYDASFRDHDVLLTPVRGRTEGHRDVVADQVRPAMAALITLALSMPWAMRPATI